VINNANRTVCKKGSKMQNIKGYLCLLFCSLGSYCGENTPTLIDASMLKGGPKNPGDNILYGSTFEVTLDRLPSATAVLVWDESTEARFYVGVQKAIADNLAKEGPFIYQNLIFMPVKAVGKFNPLTYMTEYSICTWFKKLSPDAQQNFNNLIRGPDPFKSTVEYRNGLEQPFAITKIPINSINAEAVKNMLLAGLNFGRSLVITHIILPVQDLPASNTDDRITSVPNVLTVGKVQFSLQDQEPSKRVKTLQTVLDIIIAFNEPKYSDREGDDYCIVDWEKRKFPEIRTSIRPFWEHFKNLKKVLSEKNIPQVIASMNAVFEKGQILKIDPETKAPDPTKKPTATKKPSTGFWDVMNWSLSKRIGAGIVALAAIIGIKTGIRAAIKKFLHLYRNRKK
jgi:hypothetical protein